MDGFSRVIGYEAEKKELQRYCDYFANTEKYKAIGVSLPKGILLYGEPGIGKTLMCESFIEECGIKSYVIRKELTDAEFIKHINKTFEDARSNQPAIIFLDDLDKFSNGDDEHKNTEEYVVIQSCIDECKNSDVFILATVNDRWSLPESLVRAGRFDKLISMKMPKGEDAVEIVKFYLAQKKILDEVDAEEIGRILQGRSCADLETIINEAGIYAAYDGKAAIDRTSMIKACCRVFFEEEYYSEIETDISGEIKDRRVAIHEAGHSLVSEILRPGCVSFVALGNVSGNIKGITITRAKEELEDSKRNREIDIMIALGGRAATEVILGEVDMGTIDDIQLALNSTYRLVAALGGTGLNVYDGVAETSEVMKRNLECVVNVEINRLYEEVRKIIIENRKLLETIVCDLMRKKVLTYRDFHEMYAWE